MSLPHQSEDYQTLATLLGQQGVGMTAAEMHGLLTGLVCGGDIEPSFMVLVQQLTNDGMAFNRPLSELLQKIYTELQTTLLEDGFGLQLLLPTAENSHLFTRVEALAGWVNHFLLGLGVTQPKLDQVTGEAGEAIDDLRTIGQLGYDEEEDKEILEQSLEEVLEYVRVAALLCFEQFNPVIQRTMDANKPTLH